MKHEKRKEKIVELAKKLSPDIRKEIERHLGRAMIEICQARDLLNGTELEGWVMLTEGNHYSLPLVISDVREIFKDDDYEEA